MDLHPHLHLLVPSSTPGINLEVRFYIPRHLLDSTTSPRGSRGSKAGDQLLGKPKGWSNTSASIPVAVDKLDLETLEVMKGVERLIIASHPWGRFGGNMLYPYVPSPYHTSCHLIFHNFTFSAFVLESQTVTSVWY